MAPWQTKHFHSAENLSANTVKEKRRRQCWTVLAAPLKTGRIGWSWIGLGRDSVCFLSVSYFVLLLLSFVEKVASSGSSQIFSSLFSIDTLQSNSQVSCFSVVFWPLILQLNKYWITSYVPQPFKVTVIETQKKSFLWTQVSFLIANQHPTFLFISKILEKKLVANQLCEKLGTATVRIIGQVLDSTVQEKKLWLKFQTILQIWHYRVV